MAITVFFIVLCSNAVNFVDGLDGLATGVVGIGALAFFAYSYLLTVDQHLTRATTSSLITVAIAGACLGFLPHNFFPARMFMGDSGAMLLGLLLATSTISLTGQIDTSQLQDGGGGLVPTVLPLVLPLAILALPFLDVDAGLHPTHVRGQVVVRRGQAAPAPPAARTWPQPAAGRDADVRLVGPGLLRGDRPRPGCGAGRSVAVVALCALVLLLVTLGRPVSKTPVKSGDRCPDGYFAAAGDFVLVFTSIHRQTGTAADHDD